MTRGARGQGGALGRRVPRWRDLRPLLGGGPPQRTRLEAALTINDLRELARRRTPAPAFDYTDGGSEDERSLRRARDAFDSVVFHPHVLRDVAKVDPRPGGDDLAVGRAR